jgi:hypothetical protein
MGDTNSGDDRPRPARTKATVDEELDNVTGADLKLLISADGYR